MNTQVKISSTKNIIRNGFTCLIYGEAGTGKTYDIQKLPNPIVISAEGGLLTLNKQDIPFIEVNNWIEFIRALDFVLNDETMKDKFICIDSLTIIAEYCFNHYLALDPKNTLQAYGKLADILQKYLLELQKRSRNVYVIAQCTRKTSDDGLGTKYQPMLKGSSADKIPHIFDHVFVKRLMRDKSGNLIRVIQTFKDEIYEVKSRTALKKEYYTDIAELYQEIIAE